MVFNLHINFEKQKKLNSKNSPWELLGNVNFGAFGSNHALIFRRFCNKYGFMTHHRKANVIWRNWKCPPSLRRKDPVPPKTHFLGLLNGWHKGRKPIGLCAFVSGHLDNSSPSSCETFEGWAGPYVFLLGSCSTCKFWRSFLKFHHNHQTDFSIRFSSFILFLTHSLTDSLKKLEVVLYQEDV